MVITSKPRATPTELIQTAQALADTHDCPYASDILESEEIGELAAASPQHLGYAGRILAYIDGMSLDLSNYHRNDTCRPIQTSNGRETPEHRTWSTELYLTKSLIRNLGLRAASPLAA